MKSLRTVFPDIWWKSRKNGETCDEKWGLSSFHCRFLFLIMKKEKIRKEVNYAGSDSYKCDPFRTDRDLGIIADHGSDPGCKFTTDKKRSIKKLTDTLQKADDYFQYILEEEEAEEEEEIPEIRPVERKHEKSTKKAEDAVLLQDVLTEYFS